MLQQRIQSFKKRIKSLTPPQKHALMIFCACAVIVFLMIRFSIPFRLVIVISSNPWERVDEGTLYDYEFVNSTHGWRCKSGGLIQMTTNGGLTWQTQYIDPEMSFRIIEFANTTVGAAVQYYGKDMVVTNNGGANWTALPLTYINNQGILLNASIRDISVCPDGIAWVLSGYTIFRIDIPKLNWTIVPVLKLLSSSIHMFNSTYGWVTAYNGGIFHTRNGWQNYTTQTEVNGVRPATYTGIFFWDAYRGWAVGWDETIIATSDGGAHWVVQYETFDPFITILEDVYFRTESQGWAFGTSNTYYTENGGQSWVPIPIRPGILSMCFANASHGWMLAGKNSLKTTVGGRYGLSEGLANILTGTYSCGLAIVLLHYMNHHAIRRTISRNKKCHACNALILSYTAFCGNCGTPYESQRPPDKGHPEN